MRQLTYMSIAVVVAFFSINSHSMFISEQKPLPFFDYDKNGDGVISKKEFIDVNALLSTMSVEHIPIRNNVIPPVFIEFDTNNNGTLSQDELAEGQKIQMEKRYVINIMSQNQGMKRKMPSFSDYDVDGDNMIFEKEFNEGQNKRRDSRMKDGYMMKNRDAASTFDEIDTNHNDEISREEFIEHQHYRSKKIPNKLN